MAQQGGTYRASKGDDAPPPAYTSSAKAPRVNGSKRKTESWEIISKNETEKGVAKPEGEASEEEKSTGEAHEGGRRRRGFESTFELAVGWGRWRRTLFTMNFYYYKYGDRKT
ncbi:hypothetical protein F4778DRAFT_782398 [Xylariomycetidae sp. FL2044]|nr:hypothetical protein F4778DRAFT_782398 [Xylariomycetidae sp. FL2044]